MKKIRTLGFTLIELLVVISIIGILASIVMASLGVSRRKGTNANVQTSFAQIRSQATFYVNDNGNYGSVAVSNGSCSTPNTVFMDTSMQKLITALQTTVGLTLICNNTTGQNPAWAVSTRLPQAIGSNNFICTDANNALKYSAASPGNVSVCP